MASTNSLPVTLSGALAGAAGVAAAVSIFQNARAKWRNEPEQQLCGGLWIENPNSGLVAAGFFAVMAVSAKAGEVIGEAIRGMLSSSSSSAAVSSI